MTTDKVFIAPMFLLGLLLMVALDFAGAQTGACYGRLGTALPPPSEVIALYNSKNIRRMRLYDPYQQALQALAGSNIEVMLGVPNDALENIASSQENANNWVQTNVINHPNVNFKYIAVGNEVSPLKSDTSKYVNSLRALNNIQAAVSELGIRDQIKVSSAIETGFNTNTYPPSDGEFRPEVREFINPIIEFLVNNHSPLLVNIYPYFGYAYNAGIDLDYALFRSQGTTTTNGYQNLFDAMLDATYSAVDKAGGSSLEIVVSESGWPTDGGKDTNVENAKTYNNNLIQHVKQGSPKRPGTPIEAYIFAMFDEDQKGPDELEKHWGLFLPNKQPKYDVSFI